MIAQYGRFTCREGLEEDFEKIFVTLQGIVIDSSDSITKNNLNKLAKLIGFYDTLLCSDGEEIVGACLYRHVSNYIELTHMYIKPEYRVTYGSGLLNHYLINVIAKNKNILLTTNDTTTFKKVIEDKGNNTFAINERARKGLKRMFDNKIQWSE